MKNSLAIVSVVLLACGGSTPTPAADDGDRGKRDVRRERPGDARGRVGDARAHRADVQEPRRVLRYARR
jgi:hypothetical protein